MKILETRDGMLFQSLIRISDNLYTDIVSYVKFCYGDALTKINKDVVSKALMAAGVETKKKREMIRKLSPGSPWEMYVDRMEFVRPHIGVAHARVQLPFLIHNGTQHVALATICDLVGLPGDEDRIVIKYGLTFKVPLVGTSLPCKVLPGPPGKRGGYGQECYVTQREFLAGKYSPLR